MQLPAHYVWWNQQMLYYVKDPGATISFFQSLLDKNGKLLIILVSGELIDVNLNEQLSLLIWIPRWCEGNCYASFVQGEIQLQTFSHFVVSEPNMSVYFVRVLWSRSTKSKVMHKYVVEEKWEIWFTYFTLMLQTTSLSFHCPPKLSVCARRVLIREWAKMNLGELQRSIAQVGANNYLPRQW